MEFPIWLGFFAASWAISISPGPGAVAALSAGARHGFWRGYLMTIGMVLGILSQLLAVAVGLGALIATSAIAFTVVKWGGVAYLVWLGIAQWRAPSKPLIEAASDAPRESRLGLVARGWAVNAVNPKCTVFLLAVVPQFLDLARPLAPQYLLIGATLAFTDLVMMGLYTALAARLLRLLKQPRQVRLINRVFGSLFVVAGAVLASVRRGS